MVLWNNINLKDKGIIVETSPKISKAKKNITTYKIEGRDGLLIVDKGTYNSFIASVECHFDTDKTNINDIKLFLDGYGRLSFDGETYYNAYIKNAIEFEKIIQFKKFIIQFECNPISYDITPTIKTITDENTTFNISNATAKMKPILKIVGSGDLSISINNKTFYLYDLNPNLTYTLDCDAKEIFNSYGANCSNQMQYDFPILVPGENTIEYIGNVSSFEIEYKKSYI